MTSNWKKYKLQDLTLKQNQGVNTTTEKVKYCENGTHKVVRAKNILPYRLLLDDVVYIDDNTFKKINDNCKPQKNDILYTNIGSQLGNASLVTTNEDFIIAWNVLRLQLDQTKILPSYCLYLLNSNENKQKIVSLNSSSTMPFVSGTELSKVEFTIPPLETQRKIAKVLSAIDDKIELNNSINNNLEQQTQAMFYEIYKSGISGKIEDIVLEIETGSRPKGGALGQGIPSIGAENIEKFGKYDYSKDKFISEEFFNKLNRGIVKSGDVLLYKDGAYTGKVSMALDGFPHEKCAVNEHVFIIRANSLASQYFLYFCLLDVTNRQKIHTLASSKAAQPGLNQNELKSVSILIPNRDVIKNFTTKIEPLMHLIAHNSKENRKLTQLRDTLLPKLMSGEIDVSNIEIDEISDNVSTDKL